MKKFFGKYESFLTPEEKKVRKKQLLLGLFSGVLLGISFPPVPLPYFAFFALIPYLFVLEQRKGLGEINRFTYFTFFFFNLITLYWVGSWTKDADPFLLIAGTTLMFFNPLLFLIPSTLYYYTRKKFNKNIALWLFPLFWGFYEYIYSITDFRFPWLMLSNSLTYFNEFIQIADIIGAYGLSLLVIYINIAIYKSLQEHKKGNAVYRLIALTALMIILPLVYGLIKAGGENSETKTVRFGLIQPNLNPWKKWEAGNLNDQLNLYIELSEKAVNDGAEIIVWPESALPVYLLTGSYSQQVNRIHQFIDTNSIYLVTGMPDATFYSDSTKAPQEAKRSSRGTLYASYNSILYFKPGSREVEKYGKIMLVPFGEKVPLVESIPILGDIFKWNVGISSWNTGKDIKVFPIEQKQISIGGVICIESIYPEFCSRFVQRNADVIAVVTNDSWYGNSSGPYQHKEISVLRAVENRRSVVRAANGGISCLIDPNGNTISQTKMFIRDYLVANVPVNTEITFFNEYPLLIPYICIAATLILLILILIDKIKSRIYS